MRDETVMIVLVALVFTILARVFKVILLSKYSMFFSKTSNASNTVFVISGEIPWIFFDLELNGDCFGVFETSLLNRFLYNRWCWFGCSDQDG